jgi:hypothetical protein
MQSPERQPDSTTTADGDVRAGARASLLFRLALAPVMLFIVTVLAFTASQFGDARAPAQRWLDQNVGWMLAVEVAASALLCLLAMAGDRRRIVLEAAEGDGREPLIDADQKV